MTGFNIHTYKTMLHRMVLHRNLKFLIKISQIYKALWANSEPVGGIPQGGRIPGFLKIRIYDYPTSPWVEGSWQATPPTFLRSDSVIYVPKGPKGGVYLGFTKTQILTLSLPHERRGGQAIPPTFLRLNSVSVSKN